ncbi:4-hydroxy-tetrahydrodipicolinate synthase family protein [Streptomyces sp. C10-9-1]|uniref:4-hydroxy-tetrahydrodipicolinate synthase family protein n=1 Tax=Streptomyces sp. C10-9-1 TaxID=1859285 RepID=UPI003D74C9E4
MTEHAYPQGIHVPLITPFTAAGDLAREALEGLAHTVLDAGAAGIVALGTTAEVATLDGEERRTVVEICLRVCAERGAPLTVGAGSNDTRASEAALAELGQWPGLTAALVTVPSFTRPSQEGVIAHFTRLAAVSPVPLVVYDIPYRTALPLSAATLRTLGEVPGIVAVKYANGLIGQDTVELLGHLPPGFSVMAGDDLFASPMLAMGASGGILASAHLAPRRFASLVDAWRDGDVEQARSLGHALARLSAALFREPNPTVIKGVLHERGLIPTPDVRLPLLPAGKATVADALERLSQLEE